MQKISPIQQKMLGSREAFPGVCPRPCTVVLGPPYTGEAVLARAPHTGGPVQALYGVSPDQALWAGSLAPACTAGIRRDYSLWGLRARSD